MYGLFQANVPTRAGKKIGGCNFDHGPNDFGMRKITIIIIITL